MSAQIGIWNCDGKPVDRSLLGALGRSMEHCGPDGESVHVDGSLGIIYRPFHTTQESRLEHQPYVSRDSHVLTWDGRLDNREDLASELREELPPEPTDVAIVASAFDRWGTGCLRRLIGDWALSVWQPTERVLLLAVDYMATRHIFYCEGEHQLLWSSDLTPLALFSPRQLHIDEKYIAGYLAYFPEAHLTPYREIRETPPGKFVRIDRSQVTVHRYWSFSSGTRIRYKTDRDYEEHFRHLFRGAVRRRLRTDSPILAEFSGGLDSSSIICVADDIVAKEGGTASVIDTISYFDLSEPQRDDWFYVKLIEQVRRRTGFHIDASRYVKSPAPMAYPEFDPLPGYLGTGRHVEAERSDIIRNGGYRVVLSGIGGDEFMGGIPDPRTHLADLILQFKFVELAKQLMAWSLVKRTPWIALLCQAFNTLLPASIRQYSSKNAGVDPWLTDEFATHARLRRAKLGPQESFDMLLPTRRSDIRAVLDMSNKIAKRTPPQLSDGEVRFPYLDQNLIEFILAIPSYQLLRPGDRRSLMRRALINYVPQAILARRTKSMATRMPILTIENNWHELQTIFSSPLCEHRGYINRQFFLTALDAARHGSGRHTMALLRTIALEYWLRDLHSRGLCAIDDPPSDLSNLRECISEGSIPTSFQHLSLAELLENPTKTKGQPQ